MGLRARGCAPTSKVQGERKGTAFGVRRTAGTEGRESARLEREPEINAISSLKQAGINHRPYYLMLAYPAPCPMPHALCQGVGLAGGDKPPPLLCDAPVFHAMPFNIKDRATCRVVAEGEA